MINAVIVHYYTEKNCGFINLQAYNEVSQRDNSSDSLKHIKVEIDEPSPATEDQPLIQMDDPEPQTEEETEPLAQLPVELNRHPSQTQF